MTPRGYRQSRRDANHVELTAYWKAIGGSWQDTHAVAGGLDGIAGAHGIDQRVEIKDGGKVPSARRLTEAEAKTFHDWKGRKPVVWESRSDVEATMKRLYDEALGSG